MSLLERERERERQRQKEWEQDQLEAKIMHSDPVDDDQVSSDSTGQYGYADILDMY
jgi:hypothetical protein